MPVNYPCSLPGPLVTSNNGQAKNIVRRNDLESGPPVFVLEDDDVFDSFSVSFNFDALQMQIFRNWYRWLTESGSKLFNIDLMVDGWDGTTQTKTHECYFDGVPQRSQNGRRWTVNATLISIKEQILDDCDGITLVSAYGAFGGSYGDLNDAFADVNTAAAALESSWDTFQPITCTPNYFDNNYWFDDGFVVWDSVNNRWGSVGQSGYSIENSFPPDGDPAPWSDQYRPSLLYLTLQNDGGLIQDLQLVVTADTVPFGQGNSQSIHNSFVDLQEGITSFEIPLDWSGLSIDYQIRFISLFDFINTPVYITCVQFDPP